MKEKIRIALGQINCTVGDLKGNCDKMQEYIAKADYAGVDIISFPELAVTGYPPEDLLHKPKFIQDNISALKELVSSVKDIVVIAGFVDKKGSCLFNAAAVIYKKKIQGVFHKMELPNYGVFDEKRYFSSGNNPLAFRLGNAVFGINVCEDIWHKEGPIKTQAKLGAHIIFNINASPYHAGKVKAREDVLKKQAKSNDMPIAYVNLVGGQDELVFDGQSMVIGSRGQVLARAGSFKEDLLIIDLEIPVDKKFKNNKVVIIDKKPIEKEKSGLKIKNNKPLELVHEIYEALTLGIKDYVYKNGFKQVVIGISGGVDSALVAALAVDALGKDNVTGIFMPSRYSSKESEEDSLELARMLGIKLINVSIEQIYKMYLMVFDKYFAGMKRDITEENIQARIRGNLVMAFSNKFGWLVLTTGNKSEMSTGYATLYGDMAGGFAVIKDVTKAMVYKLSNYRNSLGCVIPGRIISKEPSAELRPGQKDSDSLPPYEILDPILKEYIEEDKSLESIVSLGFDREVVSRVLGLVDKSEYKRRQAPPGIKITPKAFGRDRRMPITSKYKGY